MPDAPRGAAVIVLRDQRTRAEIMPEQGARVRSIKDLRSGRELLYRRADDRWDRQSYLPTLAGGWDQMFPNDDPWAGMPAHGTLWSSAFTVAFASSSAATFNCRLDAPSVDVEQRYELVDAPQTGLRLTTTVRARAEVGPFLWATHPMLSVATGWRIAVADSVLEADSVDPGRARPGRILGVERETVLVLPPRAQGWQEVVYGDATGEASVASADGRHGTQICWDKSFFRHLWVVTLSGFESVDLALVLEPCTARPYRLDEVVASGLAKTLHAGETRTFWSEVASLDAL